MLLLLREELGDKVVRPVLYGEPVDVLVHVLPALLSLLLLHEQRLVDRLRDLVRVERVHEDRPGAERLRRARKLGEDEHAVVVLRAGDELEGDLAHALSERGDEHEVRNVAERRHLERRDVAVEVVDRRVLERAEAAVDPPHELVHLVAQLVVACGIAAGWRGHLDEQDALRPIWVLLEELLDRNQLVRYTLDVVHPIDPKQDRLAVESPLHLDHAILELGRGEELLAASAVDPLGEGVHRDRGAVRRVQNVGGLHVDVRPQHARASRHEVTHVIVDLEADEVGTEHAAEDLLLVDLGATIAVRNGQNRSETHGERMGSECDTWEKNGVWQMVKKGECEE